MVSVLIDILILLVLAFFAWRGGKKGLILTLFSLLALFAAWFGAKAIAQHFTDPVANIIRPSLQQSIEEVISGSKTAVADDPAPSPSAPSVVLPGGPTGEEAIGQPSSGAGLTLQQVMEVLDQSEMFTGLRSFLEEAIEENAIEVVTTASAALTAYLARLIAGASLFGGSFLLILLVWFLVSRALDLGFRLPILAVINAAGGAVLGLAKGVAMMLVLVWLARLTGLLTEANAGPIARLMTIEALSDLLRSLVRGAPALSPAAAHIYQLPVLDLFTNF